MNCVSKSALCLTVLGMLAAQPAFGAHQQKRNDELNTKHVAANPYNSHPTTLLLPSLRRVKFNNNLLVMDAKTVARAALNESETASKKEIPNFDTCSCVLPQRLHGILRMMQTDINSLSAALVNVRAQRRMLERAQRRMLEHHNA